MHSFIQNIKGGVAVTVALLIVPLILFVGLTVDLGRAYYVQSVISGAIDNAVMSGGVIPSTDPATIKAGVIKFYKATLPSTFMATSTPDPDVSVTGTDELVIEGVATATLPTTFMQLIGQSTLTVSTSALVTRGKNQEPIEVVMVLDNTGSMATNNNIAALRTAAKNLVDILFSKTALQDKLFVGVVPYNNTVNVGSSRTGWLTVVGKATVNNNTFFPPSNRWMGCVQERGVFGTSNNTLDLTDTPPTSNATRFNAYAYVNNLLPRNPSNANGFCLPAMMPLSADKAALDARIDQLYAYGGTMSHVGLLWGWRLLSPRWRGLLPDPNAKNIPQDFDKTQKIIVLMTDGDNTWYPPQYQRVGNQTVIQVDQYSGYGLSSQNNINAIQSPTASYTSNQVQGELRIDTMMETVCNRIKSANNGVGKPIVVYTLAFSAGTSIDAQTRNLLRNCATSVDKYYEPDTQAELISAFQAIGNNINAMRFKWKK